MDMLKRVRVIWKIEEFFPLRGSYDLHFNIYLELCCNAEQSRMKKTLKK